MIDVVPLGNISEHPPAAIDEASTTETNTADRQGIRRRSDRLLRVIHSSNVKLWRCPALDDQRK